jgi:AcrR family transcriptional regulator
MNQSDEYDARIISGAAELFRIYGIRAVTMDTIAQHLAISKRTIYERFHDKDELLFAVLSSMIAKQKEKIESIMNSSPNVIAAFFTLVRTGRDHAAAMNPLIGSDLRKYHSSVLKRLRESCRNPDYEGAGKMLSRGMEEDLIRKDINTDIVSRCFTGLGTLAADENIFPHEKFLQNDLIKNTVINYLRGICTEKGRMLVEEMEPSLNKYSGNS